MGRYIAGSLPRPARHGPHPVTFGHTSGLTAARPKTTIRAVTEAHPETATQTEPATAAAAETGADGPTSRRPGVRVFVVVVVLLQLLVPLTYYLRDDPFDERFAWRMFSGVRLQECEASAFETDAVNERRVNLYRVIPPGWVANLQRDRQPVIERYLAHRCGIAGVVSVRVVNQCQGVDGTTLPPREYALDCPAGASR